MINVELEYLNRPFIDSEINILPESNFNPKIVPSHFDITKLDKKLTDIAEQRLKIITPLSTKSSTASLDDVKIIAKSNNVSVRSIYRWWKLYSDSDGDWKSLIPKDTNRGNRTTKISSSVEEIISYHISYKCECCKPIQFDKTKWENICNDCKEKGLKTPTLKTVTKRIKELPARERKGTQGGLIEYEIQQNITGKLPRGEYPLHFVQVDSTRLDIFVIDELSGESKRPFITIFIDTQTRMFYSYWLTLRDHTAVNVNRGRIIRKKHCIKERKDFN